MAGADNRGQLRIGELSRRVGVSGHVLRAWEARYGLIQPVRTEGGFRLYSVADELRIRRMQAHLANGLSAAEAARAALAESAEALAAPAPTRAGESVVDELAAALRRALDDFDEPAAQVVIDRALSDLTLPTVLRRIVLPVLADLGDRWESGEVSVAQEHFASALLRGRLAGLARGWGAGNGPVALLACPPGELHDLALMSFGLVLHLGGWRIHYLGINTPVEEVQRSVAATSYKLVVLTATTRGTLAPLRRALKQLAAVSTLAIAGADATASFASAVGARLLGDDPVTEAERMWRLV